MSPATRRRVLVAGAALAVVLAGLVLVGRWERSRNATTQNARMAAVFRVATSRGLISPLLDAYRLSYTFDCLLYHAPGHPSETSDYELCFDGDGRLVQTIDRHTGVAQFGSLLEQPSLASLSVPIPRVVAALRRIGAGRDWRLAATRSNDALPLGHYDVGLVHSHGLQRAAG